MINKIISIKNTKWDENIELIDQFIKSPSVDFWFCQTRLLEKSCWSILSCYYTQLDYVFNQSCGIWKYLYLGLTLNNSRV